MEAIEFKTKDELIEYCSKKIEYYTAISKKARKNKPAKENLIKIYSHLLSELKINNNMKTNNISITTSEEYLKNMTGVISTEELVQAIENKIKAREEKYFQSHIEIKLEDVKTTEEQRKELEKIYCMNDKLPWKKIIVNYNRREYTNTSHTQILLYF